MATYFMVHCHYYQPPRENPVTGKVPKEFGADPYHNFNEKITAECYHPNVELGLINQVSFNVGPTLASWLEEYAPETYQGIIAADTKNVTDHGVGNAIAQVYNHVIMPLASKRDKHIQIRWGIADFIHRFGRPPEGMWLAETAVDYASLEALVDNGISFTILAPWQVETQPVDTTKPYLVKLRGGKQISVVFYDAHLGKVLLSIDQFKVTPEEYVRLALPLRQSNLKMDRFVPDIPQLLTVASDGEYFGHHQRQGATFLREVFDKADPAGYEVTYLAKYLKEHPAQEYIKIKEQTAWSCLHGLDRWTKTCACNEGSGEWKTVLRRSLNVLSRSLDDEFEKGTAGLLADPWRAVEQSIGVWLKAMSWDDLLDQEQAHPLSSQEREKARLFLQSQYYRQWMFTSCGFFFEDLSRIEPVNDILYAAMAIDLARRAGGNPDEQDFSTQLANAASWRVPKNGAQFYEESKERLHSAV